jgi:GNAT superfamily N-acetyltransferase
VRTEIRSAIPSDAREIAECLRILGYGTSEQLVLRRIDEFSSSETDIILVAQSCDTSTLLGVVSAHALPLFHAEGWLVRLTSLAVSGKYHGQGVGRLLVAAAEDWAWSVGAQRVEVTSGDHRSSAHAFYQAIGYTLDERRFIKRAAIAKSYDS